LLPPYWRRERSFQLFTDVLLGLGASPVSVVFSVVKIVLRV
jgi:hypothetical protein